MSKATRMTQTRGKRGRTPGVGDTWKIKDELPVFKELSECVEENQQ